MEGIMGDRRMAEIRTAKGSLYVYTHWHGYDFPNMARAAIAASAPRRGDSAYEVRILVDQLTAPGRDRETGFGLMLGPDAEDSYNGDSPSIIIDLTTNTLTVLGEGAMPPTLFTALVTVNAGSVAFILA
jgi:hypothetical protein